jgi:DNA primase
MNHRPPDANAVPTIAQRRRLLEVHRAATRFFRRELLQAKKGWSTDYLASGEASHLQSTDSRWLVGYAPHARSRLVDHLRSQGFDMATVQDAGLGLLSPEGRMIDRFRDQVMFPACNDQLQTVGYFGVGRGTSPYYAASPATQIHRRSNALVGVAEQTDLLSQGAAPVLVNDPLDAVAIERISRLSAGQWAGIPLCNTLLSAEQARMLGRYAATDMAIVVLSGDEDGQRAAVDFLNDLSRFFARVCAVELPAKQSASTMIATQSGRQRLHDILLTTRPLADYRQPQKRRRRIPVPRPPTAEAPERDQSPSF